MNFRQIYRRGAFQYNLDLIKKIYEWKPRKVLRKFARAATAGKLKEPGLLDWREFAIYTEALREQETPPIEASQIVKVQ